MEGSEIKLGQYPDDTQIFLDRWEEAFKINIESLRIIYISIWI